jgi:hypothetical protein
MKPEKILDALLNFAVSEYGGFLATRDSARTARSDLEAQVAAQGQDCIVVINFAEVNAMTISFADEFLGRFYSALASGDVLAAGVLLAGFNDETREAVSICLERRDLMAAAIDHDEAVLVGRAEVLQDTYRTALTMGTFRAAELGTALSITPQNANNRLKRLVEAGAVHRRRVPVSDRGGKEFVYVAVDNRI